MEQIKKALKRSKESFKKLQEAEGSQIKEFGLVGIVNTGREIYEIDRALNEISNIEEQVLEDIKDIIIQSENHFEWQERIGVYKALNILQKKYGIKEKDMQFIDLS